MDSLKELKLRRTAEEIEDRVTMRIKNDLTFFQGLMPQEVALAWNGYLQSVLRWAPAATADIVDRLVAMLPGFVDGSSVASAHGRPSVEKISVSSEDLQNEVALRIADDIKMAGGTLPRDIAVSWSGYIQALGEWSPAATRSVLRELRGMLPKIENDPSDESAGCRLP